MNKRLTLGTDKILGGVCSGIAEYLDIDPTFIRLFWIILVFCQGVGIIPYFICWLIMPNK